MIALPQATVTAPLSAPGAIMPVAGRHYRLVSEDIRDNGVLRRRFVQITDLMFTPERDGWLVTSTLVDLSAEPADGAGVRFLAGAGAMKNLAIRIHLDAAGRLLAIDDEAAVWARLLAGIDAMADREPSQHFPLARDPAAPLRGLPPEARMAMIAAALRAAVPLRLAVGARPVTLPGVVPGDPALPGTETITRDGEEVRDQTEAFLATPAGAHSVNRLRRIGAATGLLIEAVETQTVRIGERLRTIKRTDRLEQVP